MNAVTIADIKRGGMAALDAALSQPQHGGVVTIMKRNRPAAIVLSPDVYEALLLKASATQTAEPASVSALEWLIEMPKTSPASVPTLNKAAMAARLHDLQAEWATR